MPDENIDVTREENPSISTHQILSNNNHVSATRGILSIGARLSVEGNITQQQFISAMIELGVNAAVILALGITLKLIGRFLEEKQD